MLNVTGVTPLLIMATGWHSRKMVNTNKYGFPIGKPKTISVVAGFRTGDLVRAVVPAHLTNKGTHVGRLAIRATGYGNLVTATGKLQGVHVRYCQPLHRADGYSYQKGTAFPPHA